MNDGCESIPKSYEIYMVSNHCPGLNRLRYRDSVNKARGRLSRCEWPALALGLAFADITTMMSAEFDPGIPADLFSRDSLQRFQDCTEKSEEEA